MSAPALPTARGPWQRAVRAMPTLFRVGLAEMVAYRAELIIWILTATTPIIMLLVWDKVAAGGPIGRFDQPAFGRYFIAGLVVRQLTAAWVVWELNHTIRTGSLSPQLLKPVHPLMFRAAENLVAVPFRVAVLIPLVGALWLWRPNLGWSTGLPELAMLTVAIFLAWLLSYLSQVFFGCMAFYIDQSLGIFNVWFGIWAIFSGYLFPLELLPPSVAAVAFVLPFRSMLAVPVEIAAGQLAGYEAIQAIALQAAWVGVFFFVARLMWRSGVKRYEAFGA